MKAALYARYSTDLQSESSINDQLRVARRLAESNGYEVADTYSDAAISGGTAAQPGYQAMLEAAGNREFDCEILTDA